MSMKRKVGRPAKSAGAQQRAPTVIPARVEVQHVGIPLEFVTLVNAFQAGGMVAETLNPKSDAWRNANLEILFLPAWGVVYATWNKDGRIGRVFIPIGNVKGMPMRGDGEDPLMVPAYRQRVESLSQCPSETGVQAVIERALDSAGKAEAALANDPDLAGTVERVGSPVGAQPTAPE